MATAPNMDFKPSVPFPGFTRDRIDDAIVNPEVMADEAAVHGIYSQLRAGDPVHFTQPAGFRPFWSVTKHADIVEVSKANDIFTNRQRTYLTPIEGEEWILNACGDSHFWRTLVDLDDPQHMKLRKLTHTWFQPANLRTREPQLRAIAKSYVDRMAALGGECDFVNEVALFYPLRVIMQILGVPEIDEPLMLKMTQEVFGPQDPDVIARSALVTTNAASLGGGGGMEQVDQLALAKLFYDYFNAMAADRRLTPRDDVASVVANSRIDGEYLSEPELIGYYAIIAAAGHDTTSSTASGGLVQLIKNPDQMAKLKADMSLLPSAIEEMIRWVTPVKHFMRTAMQDYTLRDKLIRQGDSLALFYWSGNRDEDAFEDPFAFKVDRKMPSGHVAFGHGVHLCLGLHLARMELRYLFEELLPRLKFIELTGEPKNTTANFVSGLKKMPVRYELV